MKQPGAGFLEDVSEPLDTELAQLFAAAREVAEPSSVSRHRVKMALRSALRDAATSRLEETGSGVSNVSPKLGAASPMRSDGVRAVAHARGIGKWLVLGGALIGGAGFWLGHWVGAGAARGTAGAEDVSAALAPASVSSADVSEASRSGVELGVTAAFERPKISATTPEPAVKEATQDRGLPRSPSEGRRVPIVEAAVDAPQGPNFRAVLDQLRRAQEQLKSGQFTLSLLLLSELDRSAGTLLWEERETTRVLALCGSGRDGAAREAAAALRARHPDSIYSMRLERSCVGTSAGHE
jgi:hypothetical protein